MKHFIYLLQQASAQRLANAMLLLGQLKQHGVGMEQDLPGRRAEPAP